MTTPGEPLMPTRPSRVERIATVLALLAIGTLPFLPGVFTGIFPRTHEGMRYETLTNFFFDALRHGFAYPRWLPELAGGLGYPTFVFYQPGFFYTSSLMMAVLGVGAVAAVVLTSTAYSIVGAAGAYLLARQYVGRGTAIACAALFRLTPYAFVDLYVRGDHSELAAMMLTPWPIACLLIAERRLRHGERGRPLATPLIVAAMSLAMIVTLHPAVAMVSVPLALALAAVRLFTFTHTLRWRWMAMVIIVAVTAAALSSPYWWFVWRNAQYVRLDRTTISVYDPIEHGVAPWRLISNYWGYGVSAAHSTGKPIEMSFQLGLPHLLLAIAGAWIGRRKPWVIATAVAYVLLVFLISSFSTPLWSLGTPLRSLQFPWRLLAVLAPLQLLLAAAAFGSLRVRASVATAIAAMCVLIAGLWYHAIYWPSPKRFEMSDNTSKHLSWQDAQQTLDHAMISFADDPEVFAAMNEFDPMWIRKAPTYRKRGPMLVAQDATISFAAWTSDYQVDAIITAPAATTVTLRQFYFPGWHVELNGQTVDDVRLRATVTPDGLMQFAIPAGTTTIVAFYSGPLGWQAQLVCAIVVMVSGVNSIFFLSRKRS